PMAAGAATVDGSDGGVADGRSGGSGDCGPNSACGQPVAIALWPSGSQRGCGCIPGRSNVEPRKRAAVRDDPSAAGVAEQSVAGDEERTGGFNVAAPVDPAGPVASGTDCHLHATGNRL